MFAYCNNNPISRFDPTGYSWWGDCWEWVKEKTENLKEKASKNSDGTGTIGVTTSAAFGAGGGLSAGITFDAKGNIGFVTTINAGGGFPSAGIGGYMTVTNAPNIYKQSGLGTVVGASGGPGVVAVGGEYCLMIDTETNEAYHGGTISVTAGLYPTVVECHGEVGYTSVAGFNIFDIFIGLADIMLSLENGG